MLSCTGCGTFLPLVNAVAKERAGWACVNCGARYRAAVDPKSSLGELGRAALVQRFPQRCRRHPRGQLEE